MKLVRVRHLIRRGPFPRSDAWSRVMADIRTAVDAVRWPPGAASFTIHAQSGRRRGEGSGVTPIKDGFIKKLTDLGWRLEADYPKQDERATRSAISRPGAFDAWIDLSSQGAAPFVAEWETGNVSSSHRALNKMALGLLQGHISGGVLILPTRELYRYLTDRVGNYPEIEPYFPLWSSLRVKNGYLGVVAVQHDAASLDVPRITKGTDGRALI